MVEGGDADLFNSDVPGGDDRELYEHYRIVADKGQGLLRIDKFLMTRIEGATRNKLQQAVQGGNVLVNGSTVKSNYKVKPLDVITIVFFTPPREVEIIPEDIPLDIIYEDDYLMVVNKPAGIVVHPGHGNYTGTLINGATWHIMNATGKAAADSVPWLVHRLDKNTTGALMLAKDEESLYRLATQFADRTAERVYLALVWGSPEPSEGTIVGNIGRGVRDRKVMEVFPDGSYGRHAVTHYKVVEEFGYVSLLECTLETGRTHQIRTHLKYKGHPVFNDDTYGGDRILKGTPFAKYRQFVQGCFEALPRQALHATKLGVIHPHSGKKIEFEVPPPDDMEEVLNRWRKYGGGD